MSVMSESWGVYRRLLRYAYTQKAALLLAVLAMVVVAATEPTFAAIIRPLIDGTFVNKDPEIIRWMPWAIIGIFAVRGVFTFTSGYLIGYAAHSVVRHIRSDVMRHMLNLPLSHFDQEHSGRLISRISYDCNQIAASITQGLMILVRDSLIILGLIGWMVYLSWELSLSVLFIAVVIAAIIVWAGGHFRRISRSMQGKMGEVTQVAGEIIDGQRVVKIFNGEQFEAGRFEKVIQRLRRLNIKMATVNATQEPLINILFACAMAWVVYLSGQSIGDDAMTPGTFVSFIAAMLLLAPPMRRLVKLNEILQKGLAGGESVFGLLDSPAEVDEGRISIDAKVRGEIAYENVRFRYHTDQDWVLDCVSFHLRAGETIALVGLSGSGKSTLVNLLPRFYHPESGRILMDGVDIEDYRLADLRQQIAYVGQQVFLFDGTVMDNIAYGLNEISEAEVQAAAEAAHAWEFIEKMPEGLHTLIGENGSSLSGGQRQRLAIARAILLDAPILIMDEATSALDNESERYIQQALETLQAQRSTLIIAHRLSTIEHADRILVMEQGRVVESGNHAELLQQDGVYAHLHQLQFHD